MKLIAITGGPSGGKTSLFGMVKERLAQDEIKVITVPEAATTLANMGFELGELFQNKSHSMQLAIAHLQHTMETRAMDLADDKTAVLCDRGLLDNLAYVEMTTYAKTLSQLNVTPKELLERYDGAIHMVSAAVGASDSYQNTHARYETLEQAQELDSKTLRAWLPSAKLHVIDNSTGFEEKLEQACRAVAHILGEPVETEIERKWRMKSEVVLEIPSHAIQLDIVQKYVEGARIRKTKQEFLGERVTTYTHTVKTGEGYVRGEIELPSNKEAFKRSSGPKVEKKRWVFEKNKQIYYLDEVFHPDGTFWLMEQEFHTISAQPGTELDHLKLEEVTNDKLWSSSSFAW